MIAPCSSETITILSAAGRFLAKCFRADGSVSTYDNAKLFDLDEFPLHDLSELRRALEWLAGATSRCVVRGTIADPARTRGVRRLAHRDEETGDAPTLRERPRRWLALDIEKLAPPPGLRPADLIGCAAFVRGRLPQEFHVARCIVAASASHGLKPDLRLRLWFWLDRPIDGAQAKNWLAPCRFVDPAIFNLAQPTYTAAPIFVPPAFDPLPTRIAETLGEEVVRVPAAIFVAPPPRPPPAPPMRFTDPIMADAYARHILENAVQKILDAEDGEKHRTIIKVSASLGRYVRGGGIREAPAREVLLRAAEEAGFDMTKSAAAIEWGLARDDATPSSPFKGLGNA